MLIGLVTFILLFIYAAIYFKFKHLFSEYRNEFEKIDNILSFTKNNSLVLREMYPMCLIFTMILVPIFISVLPLFKIGIFAAVIVFALMIVFVSVFPLYGLKYQNIRIIANYSIAVAICVVQGAIVKLNTGYNDDSSIIYWLPFLILVLLTFGLIMNGAYISYLGYKWFKKDGIINHKMKITQ